MVQDEVYRLHKEYNSGGFPATVSIPSISLSFRDNTGEIDMATVDSHAIEEAGHETSASATCGSFRIPSTFKTVGCTDVLVGFEDTKYVETKRAIKTGDSSAVMSGEIFEVGLDGQYKTVKICARVPYDSSNDLILVINLESQKLHTAWLNSCQDTHATLRRSEYANPDNLIQF